MAATLPSLTRYWLFVVVLSLVFNPLNIHAQTSDDALQKTTELVVKIDGSLAGAPTIGGGIIFGREKDTLYIATANHVVRRGEEEIQDLRITLRSHSSDSISGKLLKDFDPQLDLAVILVEDLAQLDVEVCSLDLLRLGESSNIKRGVGVFPVGHPNGVSWFISSTSDPVAQIVGDVISFESFRIGKGHSGGGLLDEVGGLVGMIRSDQPPFGQAISLETIIGTLKEWEYPVSIGRVFNIEQLIIDGDLLTLKKVLGDNEKCSQYDLVTKKYGGFSSLHLAAPYKSNKQMIQFLLHMGANVNEKSPFGETALYLACNSENEEIVKVLIQAGADVQAKGRHNLTVLHRASGRGGGNEEIVRMLIQAGADSNVKDDLGNTPLHYAVDAGISGIVKVERLVQAGADVNAKDDQGNTPLHRAVDDGRSGIEKVEILIQAGADVFAKTNSGDTPLHLLADGNFGGFGVSEKKLQMAKMLIQAGANVNEKNQKGKSPYHIALQNSSVRRNPDLITFFQNEGAIP